MHGRDILTIVEGTFETPRGLLKGSIKEIYFGLKGQPRVCFVDEQGRVDHFDIEEVTPEGDPTMISVMKRTWPTEITVEYVK